MQVRNIMTPYAETLPPEATIQEAAQRMKELDVGTIPVCAGGKVIGMVTDRDITIRATAAGQGPATPVDKVMTENAVSCREDDDTAEVARLMERHQIRRLIVLSNDGQLAGIVSLGDLAVHPDPRAQDLAGEALEEVSQPSRVT